MDAIARLAPKALFCQDPDRAGQESVAKGIAALRKYNAGPYDARGRVPDRAPAAGEDPADVVQKAGAEQMRALLEQAIPIERFEVERALEQTDASTDDMLATIKPIIASMSATLLRDEHRAAGRRSVRDAAGARQPAPPGAGHPPVAALHGALAGEMRGRGEPRAAATHPAQLDARRRGGARPHGGGTGRSRPAQSRPPATPPTQTAPQTASAPAARAPPRGTRNGPPPLEWDGFSGDDDFDPGAMGSG